MSRLSAHRERVRSELGNFRPFRGMSANCRLPLENRNRSVAGTLGSESGPSDKPEVIPGPKSGCRKRGLAEGPMRVHVLERRILRASGRLSIYKTPTNSPSGALCLVTGKYRLPDARNETLRPCRVRRVFVAKLLSHHPLFRADAKRAEDRERDQVRRTCHPIRDDERLADGIQR